MNAFEQKKKIHARSGRRSLAAGSHRTLLPLAATLLLALPLASVLCADCPPGTFCPPHYMPPVAAPPLVPLQPAFPFQPVSPGQFAPQVGAPTTSQPYDVQPTRLAAYHQAIVRVGRQVLHAPGQSASGTGTLLAVAPDKSLVLTAAHVVAEEQGPLWVDFGDRRIERARLLGVDPTADLAALAVDHPPGIRPLELASDNEYPRAGDNVEVAGFGGGVLRHYRVGVRGYTTKDEAAHDQIVVAFLPISGDSGGPILYRGKVAGVLWGGPSDGAGRGAYETHATCCLRIRKFLDRLGIRPRVAARPADALPPDSRIAPVGPTQKNSPESTPNVVVPPASDASAPIAPPLVELPPAASSNNRLEKIQKELATLNEQIKQRLENQPDAVKQVERAGLRVLLQKTGALLVEYGPNVLTTGTLAIPGLGIPLGGLYGLYQVVRYLFARRQTKKPSNGAKKGPVAQASPTTAVAPRQSQTEAPVVVHTDNPPSPQITSTTQQFYPVQTPTNRQRALEEAIRMFGQKYPSKAPDLNLLESWAQQLESGMQKAESTNS